MTRSLALTLLVVLLAPGRSPAQGLPATTLLRVDGFEVEDLLDADIDGDGLRDLVVAAVDKAPPHTRWLRIHLRRASGVAFSGVPDVTARLTPDVSAFAALDLAPSPGSELMLFNASGAFLLDPGEDGVRRPVRLLRSDFLWQFPGPWDLFSWQDGLRDVDGDGLPDVVMPEPDALRIAFQERDAVGGAVLDRAALLRVPVNVSDASTTPVGAFKLEGRRARKGVEFRLRFGGSGGDAMESQSPLLEVVESTPVPAFLDWDGDGDLDVMMRTTERLHVWLQGEARVFPEDPSLSMPMPVVADRERILDLSYSAHMTDLNRDGRADCVIIGGDQRSEDVRTQVLVYIQGADGRGAQATTPEAPLFGPKGLPQQALVLGGFAALPQLTDINGDGLPDLALVTFRPDLADTLRSSAGGRLELDFFVFLNRGGTFSPTADVARKVAVAADDLATARKFLSITFVEDLDGDGIQELFLQDAPDHARVFSPRRAGRGLSIGEEPWWDLSWDFNGAARLLPVRPGRGPEILVRGYSTVLHARKP